MPEQERPPRRSSRPRDGQASGPSGSSDADRTAPGPGGIPAPDGTSAPIGAGAPGIGLDGAPATLRWAVWLLWAQAAALLVVAGVLVYDAATGTSQSVTSAVAIVVFTTFMAAIVGGLAHALTRRRRWARGPALVLELLLLPIGYSIMTNGVAALGVALIVIGLGGVVTLLAPATRGALEDH